MTTVKLGFGSVLAFLLLASGCGPEAIELEHPEQSGGTSGAGAQGGSGGTGGAAVSGAGGSDTGGTGGSSTDTGGTGGAPVAGAGGGSDTGGGPASGGSAGAETSGTGGAMVPLPQSGDPCGPTCAEGLNCFNSSSGAGRCAPLCADQDQSAWGTPCDNPLTGKAGICLPANDQSPGPNAGTGQGICTSTCDPLEQDCPDGFTCDVTEDAAGQAPNRIFACLPLMEAEPFPEGAACNGFPTGECDVGLSCIPGFTQADYGNCAVLCDAATGAPCSAQETCEVPEYFPPAMTIGVCAES